MNFRYTSGSQSKGEKSPPFLLSGGASRGVRVPLDYLIFLSDQPDTERRWFNFVKITFKVSVKLFLCKNRLKRKRGKFAGISLEISTRKKCKGNLTFYDFGKKFWTHKGRGGFKRGASRTSKVSIWRRRHFGFFDTRHLANPFHLILTPAKIKLFLGRM